MGQVLIQDLDDAIIDSLKTKAELRGHSLDEELRDILTRAAPLTPDEKVALFRKLRAKSPQLGEVDVSAAIRFSRTDATEE